MAAAPFERLPGADVTERFASLGIRAGEEADLLALRTIALDHDVEVWVYFDEEVARASTVEDDLAAFEMVPEPDRPFMEIRRFFAFMESIEPGFAAAMETKPVVAKVVAVGDREAFCACVLVPRPYVKVLLG
ncbi:MAG: hypothetical protein PWP08_1613 [Methanofollis sp.]|nr:hypothetical protein [Methanofollis sp.]